jgi:pyrroline-5-carboxylate reductase
MTAFQGLGVSATAMDANLHIAFIGGGNMASALGEGMAGHICPAANFHVLDTNTEAHANWVQLGASVATLPTAHLTRCKVWIYAVKPQFMHQAVAATRDWLGSETLVISVAAGIGADICARWLGSAETPWHKLVRCMPNTPALVGQGVTGILALPSVNAQERALVTGMFAAVGKVVWVDSDAAIDAVTALSGSGPAYVFRFIEALIVGGLQLGLDEKQARDLALATVSGATHLASVASDSPQVLRERVTSKGGTTAAALKVLEDGHFFDNVVQAIAAAAQRSRELTKKFGQAGVVPPSAS